MPQAMGEGDGTAAPGGEGLQIANQIVKRRAPRQPISFEFIRDKNPDILYIVDRDSVTGEAGTHCVIHASGKKPEQVSGYAAWALEMHKRGAKPLVLPGV